MKEIIPSTFDPIFKAILTDPNLRDYLCYLISEITDLDYNELYENITIINPEIPIKYTKQKSFRSDLILNIDKNIINIEANREKHLGTIIKNNRYHHSIASDMQEGEEYKENYVYQINFNEYNHFKRNSRVLDKVMLMNTETLELDEETYQRYHINLAQLKKKYYNKEELTQFEKRCLLLTITNVEDIKKLIKNDEMMERVYGKIMELNERKSILDSWDSEKEAEKARNFDMKKEKEKGIEQGLKQEKTQIVKNMKKENMDIELISKITGLTKEEIETIY